MKHRAIAALLIASLLPACETIPNKTGYQGSGAILGAAGGSYIGQLMGGKLGAAGGGIGGAFIGFNIIRLLLNKEDEAKDAFNHALEFNSAGVTTSWRNRHGGSYGSYTPMRTIKSPTGVYCREIYEVVRINHRLFSNTVQACRHGRKDWRLIPQAETT